MNREAIEKVITGIKQIIEFACKDGITDIVLKGWVEDILKEAGYRLPPELKVLTDDEITNKLKEIQPEGFNWVNVTKTEMIKFKAIVQAQRDADKARREGKEWQRNVLRIGNILNLMSLEKLSGTGCASTMRT